MVSADHTPSVARNGWIDSLRTIGAVGIVAFHMDAPGGWLGYAALPFFIALSLMLPSSRGAWPRALDLLRLWLVWSGIYAGLKLIEIAVTETTLAQEFPVWTPVIGPVVHLWFLPYVAVALLVQDRLLRHLTEGMLTGAALLALVVVLALRALLTPTEPPLGPWIFGLPALLAGLALRGGHRGTDLAVLCLVVGAAILLRDAGTITIATGLALLVIARQLTAIVVPGLVLLAPYALGVYLIHPIVISVCRRLVPAFQSLGGLAALTIVVAISFGIVWLLSRWEVTRRWLLR